MSTKQQSPKLAKSDKNLIGRLWREFIKKHFATFLLALLFMVIVAMATAAYTWLLKFIVDSMGEATASTDATASAKSFIKLIVPAVIGLTAISGISLFIQAVLTNKIALSVVGDLQKRMFASLQNMDFATLSSKPVGNYVSHFTNDVNLIAQALLRVMNNLGRDLLTLVFLIAAMFWHNWQMSLVILLVYPLAIWPILVISKKIRGSSNQAQQQMGKINALLNESLGGTRMVRTYGLEPYENARLGKAFDERVKLYLKLVSNQARVDPIMEILAGLAIAGVFAFGVYQMSGGQAKAGDLVAVLTALGLAAPKIRALGTLNNVVQEGMAALKRVFAILDQTPEIKDSENAITLSTKSPIIEFDKVGFSYPDGTEALANISFCAKPNTTTALVGPSGGGKSTIINLIPRLYDVNHGCVKIDGIDIKDLSIESLRQHIALVSQDIVLFDDTIAANIGFGKQNSQKPIGNDEIIKAAKAAAADEFISALPDGYETMVGENGSNLSGGQRQRIALARAFLRDAPIVLLDEATSALDAASEAKIQIAMQKLTNNRTVIIIAHRLATIKNADQILVLDQGNIVETGTHASLSKQKGLYGRLCDLQFS